MILYPNLGRGQQFSGKPNTTAETTNLKRSKPIVSKEERVAYSFSNAVITKEEEHYYYEVDVMVSSTTPFKLGSGQLYINYNEAAFGTHISNNNKLVYSQPEGTILSTKEVIPVYKDFIQNDNKPTRFSISYQQGLGSEYIQTFNVTTAPKTLLHLKIKYVDTSQSPNICFETSKAYVNQTYTARATNSNTKNTIANVYRLENEAYNCEGARLSKEALEQAITETGVVVYPNPMNDAFYIRGLEHSSHIQVFDLLGRIVIEKKNYQGGSINTAKLSNGVYQVRIHQKGEETILRKIVKE